MIEDEPTYISTIGTAAQAWLDTVRDPQGRFKLGLPDIDILTRGFGPRELVMVIGFAHGGKTQLVLNAIVNNATEPILMFSLDDPAEMIVVKLLSLISGIAADRLEDLAQEGDPQVSALLASTDELFPNLIVIDQALSLPEMEAAVVEATDHWGRPPSAVVLDYLGLIPSVEDGDGGSAIQAKAKQIRRFSKQMPCPTLCLHQGTKSQCPPGHPITIMSAAYGGEAEGTFMIGVRRKSMREDVGDWERRQHENTITLHLPKNKRPPGKKTPWEGIDFHIDQETGKIRPLHGGDLQSASATTRDIRNGRRVEGKPDDPSPELTKGLDLLADAFAGKILTDEEPF